MEDQQKKLQLSSNCLGSGVLWQNDMLTCCGHIKFVRLGLSRVTLIFVAVHYGTGSICHYEITHGNFRSSFKPCHISRLSYHIATRQLLRTCRVRSTVHNLTRVAVRFDRYHHLKMIKHQARSLSNPCNIKQKYDTSTGDSILYP